MKSWIFLIFTLVSLSEACGNQSGGALCHNGLCCSQFGFCGSTDDYCGNGCQSQCTASLISQSLFDEILKHRNDASCPGKGFYTYDAFIAATSFFDSFGTTGDNDTRKREIAAFLAQTSHVTSGGGLISPDGPYAWGYCYVEQENNSDNRCELSTQWPCAPGEKYYGRGPIQISYNYNYGPAGKAIGFDLLKNPELVATDPIVSFKTALWYWMTPQSLDPSCHNVITGGWEPTNADKAAGRVPGYGMITNIISRGVECSEGANDEANNIGFYTRYCDILGVSYGDNLSCSNQSLVPRGKELPPINGAMVFLGSHHASGGSSTRVVQGQLTSFTVSIFAATWWMWQLL